MKNNRKQVDNKNAVFAILVTIIISLLAFIFISLISGYSISKPTYAVSHEEAEQVIKSEKQVVYKAKNWDILKTIKENTKTVKSEEILQEEEDLEYTTIYKENKDLPKGTMQVVQEGRDGKQQVITKKYYENQELVNETVNSNILVAAIDKVVEIGAANYSSNYKIKVGDILYVTSDTLAVRINPDKEAEKIITISKNNEVKLLEIQDNWYKIKYNNYQGYVPTDCVTYINPNIGGYAYSEEKKKSELLAGLSKSIKLNKPSGLTLEQFKKVLSNNKQDTNKVFQNNAEYFYYIEKQYKINGLFVAAVGIHESNWATSKISLDKRNLFGYGASDSNPYVNAKTFSTYAEGIDMVARVFVKYYINPAGTSIYDGGKASGKYYSGSTIQDVNKRYASDKNWHEGVYKWMSYLYNRL